MVNSGGADGLKCGKFSKCYCIAKQAGQNAAGQNGLAPTSLGRRQNGHPTQLIANHMF